jgi:uncharacterized protein YyaL (SSP411 family)
MNINQKTNRLINELSPYLLQHAYNPVDWFPWCDEAFDKAKAEDKPVFLSIGYSTCHWCHVMAHESFEDEEIAALMNGFFINIKVDREEKPDIDSIYMQACQMLNGSGGWPLTIIMTHDKKPFFTGTYFPKESKWGRHGIKELILKISELWKENREEIFGAANDIVSKLNSANQIQSGEIINTIIFEKAFKELSFSFDSFFGGFGSKPKFPMPSYILFLLRYWKRFNQTYALDIVEKTLDSMRNGGIYDHLGYGFHRYSTDEKWLVPHFEKMLYDQALLSMAYSDAYQGLKKEEYKQTVHEIFEYIEREITSPEGAFYSAEDADSERMEGKFYVWDINEIKAILGNEADLFINVFNMSESGNFIIESAENENGVNILHVEKPLVEIAEEEGLSDETLKTKMKDLCQKLFQVREKRVHPFKDDKVLCDWNGLMIASHAKASQIFQNDNYLIKAEKAIEFILNKMINSDGTLLHRYRNGEAGIKANLDDYAFLIWALLELYQASFNLKYLEKAIDLNENCINHFWSDENNCFYFTSDTGETQFVRRIELFDGAVPSGNSVAMMNLVRIGRITGNTELIKRAENMTKAYSNSVDKSPSSYCKFLCGFDELVNESMEIVIVGDKRNAQTNELMNLSRNFYHPGKLIILKNSDVDSIDNISELTKDKKMTNNAPTAYVCKNNTCFEPVNKPEDLLKLLNDF